MRVKRLEWPPCSAAVILPMRPTFDDLDLHPQLLSALASIGHQHPTQVQLQAVPLALAGHNLLIEAPTGTGKTAAYLLPALQHLLDFPRRHQGPPRILVLVPTRELASQVAEYGRQLAANVHLNVGPYLIVFLFSILNLHAVPAIDPIIPFSINHINQN